MRITIKQFFFMCLIIFFLFGDLLNLKKNIIKLKTYFVKILNNLNTNKNRKKGS